MAVAWTVSPWLDSVESAEPALAGEVSADVAIIGAGLTGLSAALALAQRGMSVVVLERDVAGYGASGRNAGHLTPTIGKDLPTLVRLYGKQAARGLVGLAERSIEHAEHLIREHGIECDYVPAGNVLAACTRSQEPVVKHAARAAAQMGTPGRLLDAAEMRERGLPGAFRLGFLEPTGGVLNPARYVCGLRRAALAAGVRLHERTTVLRARVDPRIELLTHAGRVSAETLVVATNAWTPALSLPVPGVARIEVQLFRTAPLTGAQRARIGWPGGEGVYTAHEILESYRPTADGRIVGGSRYIRYGYGGRALPAVDPQIATQLTAMFHRRFPELDDVTVTDHWGGPIAFALDFLPHVGRAGARGHVLYALGYAGHGVAQASYAGIMLADLLEGRPGSTEALSSRRRLPLPPEPLRWAIAQALIGILSAIDRRSDRS